MSFVDNLTSSSPCTGSRMRTRLCGAFLGMVVAGALACSDDVPETEQVVRAQGGTDERGSSDPAALTTDAADAPLPEPPAGAPLASVTVPTLVEDPKVAPYFKVYRPTDLKALDRPLPVVAWANGGCLRTEFVWEPLYKRWAAAGMIVLALSPSPQAGLLGSFETTNVANHRALLAWALAQNELEGSPYYGRIDTKRLVAAGNSCGGVTALGVAAEEPRVSAVFVLSGSSALANTNRTVMGKIRAPIGYVVGGKEDIAAPNALADFEAIGAGIPAILVSRTQGDHLTVSSSPPVLADVAKISLDWLDYALFRSASALVTLQSPNVCTGCAAGTWVVKSKNL